MKAFAEYLADLRSEIDQALDRYTRCDDDCPESLREAMRHSLLGPGKRLRPLLVLMAAEACGCRREAAMPAACAVEMVHTYSLIHDDLPAMDDDDLRRGRPSCHAQFGEAMAILAGDALLTLAFEVLARDVQPPEVAAALLCRIGPGRRARRRWWAGRWTISAVEFQGGDLALLESIHRRKTGAMINVSLRLGGLVARAAAEQLEALAAYGKKLGLAFQIVDDILDLRGDEAAMGKRLGKDSARGKLTFPSILGLEESERRAEPVGERGGADAGDVSRAGRRALPLGPLCYSEKSMNAMHPLLSQIQSAEQLQDMSLAELNQLAEEIREVLCNLLEHAFGPFRLQSGRRRALSGSAQRVRFSPRSADLGHGASDLPAQAGDRAATTSSRGFAPRVA